MITRPPRKNFLWPLQNRKSSVTHPELPHCGLWSWCDVDVPGWHSLWSYLHVALSCDTHVRTRSEKREKKCSKKFQLLEKSNYIFILLNVQYLLFQYFLATLYKYISSFHSVLVAYGNYSLISSFLSHFKIIPAFGLNLCQINCP